MANIWTESDLATLRAGHAAGSPLGEIAHALGRSYNAVAHKADKLGLRASARPQRSASDLTAEIRARWGRMTNAEIATDLGLLYDRVRKLAAEAGMGTNPCTHNVPCGITWRAPRGMRSDTRRAGGARGTARSRPPLPSQRAPWPGRVTGRSSALKSWSAEEPGATSTPWGPRST